MNVFVLFPYRLSSLLCVFTTRNLSEWWEAIARSPALDIVAPEHQPVFVRLEHACALRHGELDIRPGGRIRPAFLDLLIHQLVPGAAVVRVMRIRSRVRILRLRRIEVENLQSFRLQVTVRVQYLQLDYKLVNIHGPARSHLGVVMKLQQGRRSVENGKVLISGLLRWLLRLCEVLIGKRRATFLFDLLGLCGCRCHQHCRRQHHQEFSHSSGSPLLTGLSADGLQGYARSNCAYFSTSFFKPKRGNCTVILASSPSPSRRKTVPSPYFGCRTFCPGRNPRLPVGSSTGGALGTLNFFPRLAKNSAMFSIEL